MFKSPPPLILPPDNSEVVKLVDRVHSSSLIQPKDRELFIRKRSPNELVAKAARICSNDLQKELLEDILADATDLITEGGTSTTRVAYPPTDLLSSSVLMLDNKFLRNSNNNNKNSNNNKKSDKGFLTVLQSIYRSTAISSDRTKAQKRCSLIALEGKVVHTIDFLDESDYWNFIAATKASVAGRAVEYQGNCNYAISGRANDHTANNIDKNNKGIFGSIFTKVESASQSIEIRDTVMTVRDVGKGDLNKRTVDLAEVEAIALTMDYQRPTDLLLEVSLETAVHHEPAASAGSSPVPVVYTKLRPQSNDLYVKLIGDVNEQISEHWAVNVQDKRALLLIPTTEDYIRRAASTSKHVSTTSSNRNSVGEIGNVTVAVFSSLYQQDQLASQPIPYKLFLLHASNEAACSSYNTPVKPVSTPSNSTVAFSPKSDQRKSLYGRVSSMSRSYRRDSSDKYSPTSSNKDQALDTSSIDDESTMSKQLVDEPVFSSVELKLKSSHRAVRVFIKFASNLPAVNPKAKIEQRIPPAAYCTVYLVDEIGEKLTSNKSESRTEAVKSFDPEYNKEILLHDDQVGIDTIFAVMILVRDASSGMLKHSHIGQATVPIGCFLYNTEADFCIPLEATYRMPSDTTERVDLGNVHFTTELVDVDIGNNRRRSTVDKVPEASKAELRVRSPMPDRNALIKYELHRTHPSLSWWPMRVLNPSHNRQYSISHVENRNRGKSSENGGNNHGIIIASSANYHGAVLCCYGELLVQLSPDAGGLMWNCKELEEGIVRINWSNVENAIELTESVVLLTPIIHVCISSASQVSKAEKVYAPMIIEIIVAPCPATHFCSIINFRKAVSSARAKLWDFANVILFDGGERLTNSDVGMRKRSLSMTSPKMARKSSKTISLSGTQNLTLLHNVASVLESIFESEVNSLQQLKNALAHNEINSAILAEDNPNSKYRDYNLEGFSDHQDGGRIIYDAGEQQRQYWLHNCIHAWVRVLYAQLRHICRNFRHEDEPTYTFSAALAIVDHHATEIGIYTPEVGEDADHLMIVKKYERFLKYSTKQIREYILFSADAFVNGSAHSAIEKLVESYHNAFRKFMSPYVASKDHFRKLNGQAIKNTILRLLIERNNSFNSVVQSMINVGLNMQAFPKLLLFDNITKMADWYSSALLYDNKKWLAKTFHQAALHKENKFNLPWDVEEMNDGTFVSFLPDSLRQQLNIYTELCERPKQNNDIEEIKNNDMTVISTDLHSNQEKTELDAIDTKINHYIAEAMTQSLILLADEYRRALQSKHWDQGDRANGEMKANMNFLLAVVNDTHRVITIHTQPILVAEAKMSTSEGSSIAVQKSFLSIIKIAVKFIVRTVFADVQLTLIDFADLWADSHNTLARSLSATLSYHFQEINRHTSLEYYMQIVVSSCLVVFTRVLLFLKERAAMKLKLSKEEVDRLRIDVEIFQRCFEKALAPTAENNININSSEHELDQLHEAKYKVKIIIKHVESSLLLLTLDYDTAEFLHLVKAIVREYVINYPQLPQNYLIDCISAVRWDGGSEISNFITIAIAGEKGDLTTQKRDSVVELGSEEIELKSILVLVFGGEQDKLMESMNGSHAVEVDDGHGTPITTTPGNTKSSFLSPLGKKHRYGGATGGSSLKKNLNPSSAFKHLREKAADIAAKGGLSFGGFASKRKNEEYALSVMRTIGLEVGHIGDSLSDDDNVSVDGSPHFQKFNHTTSISRYSEQDHQDDQSSDSDDSVVVDNEIDVVASKKTPLKSDISKNFKQFSLDIRNTPGKHDKNAFEQKLNSLESEIVTISLKWLQVKALHSSSLVGKANPYIKISITNVRPNSLGVYQRFKTSVKWNTCDAIWKDSDYEIKLQRIDLDTAKLLVRVFDKERIRRKRLLGAVAVKLKGLELHSFDSWYALEGGSGGSSGNVFFSLTLLDNNLTPIR